MKAVIIRGDGFMQYRDVSDNAPWLRSYRVPNPKFYPADEKNDITSIAFDITEYRLVRSFVNEFNQEVLIYKEL